VWRGVVLEDETYEERLVRDAQRGLLQRGRQGALVVAHVEGAIDLASSVRERRLVQTHKLRLGELVDIHVCSLVWWSG